MYIVPSSQTRRVALRLGLLGVLALAGCDGGGDGGAVLAPPDDSNPLSGKAKREAREKAYGPSANPPTGKVATPKPKEAPKS